MNIFCQSNEIGADTEMAVSIPNIVFGLEVRVRFSVRVIIRVGVGFIINPKPKSNP